MLENWLSGLKLGLLAFIIFMPVEYLFALRQQKSIRRGILTDIAFLLFNTWPVAAGLLVFWASGVLASYWITPAPVLQFVRDLPYWLQLLPVFFLADLGSCCRSFFSPILESIGLIARSTHIPRCGGFMRCITVSKTWIGSRLSINIHLISSS